MMATKEHTRLSAIGFYSNCTVVKYAIFYCAINLQKISELIDSAWTFSIYMYMSTHMSTSHLDILIRLHINHCYIATVHPLALPVYERHTGLVVFDIASQDLDIFCPT